MATWLGERVAGHRWILVVGKGGVGKSTTAAALALSLADAGAATHLISTDPAHSLADLFGAAPAPRPAPSPCTPRLVLEELDAEAFGQRWRQARADALREILERGTYLDAADVRPFLELSLPGADELMAALRLVELDEAPAERIVVDTAPTGHTLRLLDAGPLLGGWASAFDAMEAKAEAVAAGLTGRDVQLAGAAILDRLREDVRRFEAQVLGAAALVVVSRPDPVVRAETERLREALAERGLRVAAEVVVGGGTADAVDGTASAPRRPGVSGCEALRRYSAGEVEPAPDGGAPGAAAAGTDGSESVLELLREARLVLFAGKGGVGKTTCAAAAALALGRDEPVTLYSTDPAGSLASVLALDGLPAEGGVDVAPRVQARQVDAVAALEAFRGRYVEEVDALFSAVGLEHAALDREVVASLRDLAPPGVDEIFAVATIAADEGGRVVVDTSPTGHFLRLLEMPGLALEWLHALMRVVLRYGTASLEPLSRRLLEAARRLRRLEAALHGGEAAVVVVGLDEPLVRAETTRLEARLSAAGVRILARLDNRAGQGPGPVAPAGAGVPRIVAPELVVAPRGASALRDFFQGWHEA